MVDSLEKMVATRTKVTATIWRALHNHGGDEGFESAVNFYVYLDIFWIAEDDLGECYTECGQEQYVGTLEAVEKMLWDEFVSHEMASRYGEVKKEPEPVLVHDERLLYLMKQFKSATWDLNRYFIENNHLNLNLSTDGKDRYPFELDFDDMTNEICDWVNKLSYKQKIKE
jgi:hypothetical protein